MKLVFALGKGDYGEGEQHCAVVTTTDLYADDKTLPSVHMSDSLPDTLSDKTWLDEVAEGVFVFSSFEEATQFKQHMLEAKHLEQPWWLGEENE